MTGPAPGFFGPGRMGAPIARRLVDAGYRVIGSEPAPWNADDVDAVSPV